MYSICKIINWVKYYAYFLITRSYKQFYNLRVFRFGIPLVMKMTPRTTSTEADALRFLNSKDPSLPIPRLIDSFVVEECTYTIMTRIRGELLYKVLFDLPPTQVRAICSEVEKVLQKLKLLKQTADEAGMVMMSASGHGVPDARYFHEVHSGPFPSTLSCYAYITNHDSIDAFVQEYPEADRDPRMNDSVVYVHPDLRTYNVLVQDGHLSGIIDWEDSGSYPMHWQTFTLRWACPGCMGHWILFWNEYLFPEAPKLPTMLVRRFSSNL